MRLRIVVLTVAIAFLLTAWNEGAENWFVGPARGDKPRTAKQDASWVAQRVDAWQPIPEERAFDQIGWAKDLGEAQRLAKQHRRPVFLFTYDGASLSGYRC
jgi:hypothetical protein